MIIKWYNNIQKRSRDQIKTKEVMIMFELAMELVMNGAEVYASSMYGDILLDSAYAVECEFDDVEEEGYIITYKEVDGKHYFYFDHEDYDE